MRPIVGSIDSNYPNAHGQVCVGIVIYVDPLHIGLPCSVVELIHVVLLAPVHVNGLIVDEHWRRIPIDLANNTGAAICLIDHHEVISRRRPQVYAGGRKRI